MAIASRCISKKVKKSSGWTKINGICTHNQFLFTRRKHIE